jgi:curved DNA-binding protein CbpA
MPETICIDGYEFDPYFMLDITLEDSDDKLKKSFKEKAKKYHPDKAKSEKERKKFENRFRIIYECYNYIKTKRENKLKHSHKKKEKKEQKASNYKDSDNSPNVDNDNIILNPNDFGYVNSRFKNEDDYKNFKVKIFNQFKDRKFSIEEFNLLFEYINEEDQEDLCNNKERSLIHRTSDGFTGFNTADMNNCALVSSFRGLLITGDDFGESGKGYWGKNFSDYKLSFDKKKNPDEIVKIPSNYKETLEKKKKIKTKKYDEYKKSYQKHIKLEGSLQENNEKLYSKTLNDLIEKEESDKKIVMKYIKQYDNETIRKALDGQLEVSPTLLEVLNSHYNIKRIGN